MIATKAMVSLGDRCLFGLFVSVALCDGCSEQSERRVIFSRVRRCGVPSVEDKSLWARVCYGSVGVLWSSLWYALWYTVWYACVLGKSLAGKSLVGKTNVIPNDAHRRAIPTEIQFTS